MQVAVPIRGLGFAGMWGFAFGLPSGWVEWSDDAGFNFVRQDYG